MLEKERVERAVDIQNRSYRLLLWLEGAIEKGFVRFDRAHEYLEAHEAAMDWITVRPAGRSGVTGRRLRDHPR